MKKSLTSFGSWKWIAFGIGLIVLNSFAIGLNYRWDMTSSGLYTLSERNQEIVQNNDKKIVATLFMGDNIPASFKKLKSEAEFFLSQLHSENQKIWFDIFDPTKGSPNQINALKKLFKEKNVNPINIRITGKDEVQEKLIYPYIHLDNGDSELFINILENRESGKSEEDAIFKSIQKLEAKIAKGIFELSKGKSSHLGLVAFDKLLKRGSFQLYNHLKKNYITEILSPRDAYLQKDSVQIIIIPVSPEEVISKQDIIYIDQFVLNGGKVIWMIEEYNLSLDSLNQSGSFLPTQSSLTISDYLFYNGVKLSGSWLADLRCSRIPQVIGEQGGKAQTEMFNYPYHTVLEGSDAHLITSGLSEINFFYPTIIETVKTSFRADITPLISSSEYSKNVQYPNVFSFESLRENPNVDEYEPRNFISSVIVEGQFSSYFKSRMLDKQKEDLRNIGINFISEGLEESAQIIITDQSAFMSGSERSGRPYPLGYNKWERAVFKDNEVLLNNMIEYLLNGNEFLLPDERSEYKLASLDKRKVNEQGVKWTLFNLLFPLLVLFLVYLAYSRFLKFKYA